MSRTRGGKKRFDEMSDDESEDEEERASTGRGATVNEWLKDQCQQLQSTVKSLQREIRVLKSNDRKMKRQLRIDYDWDGEEANLSDKVSNWVKTYLFPRYKFLNDGWMSYQDGYDSLSSFVQRKMKLEVEDEFQGLWDRVISPTIQQKYVTVRCNLNNEVRKVYKIK
jgi:DNA polymerase sigma